MRKITKQAVENFYYGSSFRKSNTEVVVEQDHVELRLFNNVIAIKDQTGIKITDADWDTRTTYERLNGLIGVNISVRKGVTYLNNQPWDGSWKYI